ncbi:MAG: hypothetical protein IT521_12720 [Burkholderiales bacterium]|nr:hypothetical protein [Burkholderiales bacterium]
MTLPHDDDPRFGPWNPGVESRIPAHLLHMVTLFRPENARATLQELRELHDLTGLPLTELATLRPERLALHEVLVRVTANVSVPDGTRIEDLGINFRKITQTIVDGHVAPQMTAITAAYDATRNALSAVVARETARLCAAPPAAPSGAHAGGWRRLFDRGRRATTVDQGVTASELVTGWERHAHAAVDEVDSAAARALARTVSSLLVRHGRLWGDPAVIARVAVDLAANELGASVIGECVEPIIKAATVREGFHFLPPQQHPVVMNTKGASAAGKSTMRLLQRRLAGRIGVDWSDFALISPDIWRKQLLDYASLGDAYKYAGAFTGEELQIIDHKLDRYMAGKAQRGAMSHLLIDRFRFDSFAPLSDEAGSNLLTRFGDIVYLFFLVTPPHLLVERAWNRGLDVGRYKAVDDTLAHAVEAYSGMPELFFTWVRRTDKRVHFEFLDNTVERGAPPRTAAFGVNGVLNVLDVGCLLACERYRKIDVDARTADAVYRDDGRRSPTDDRAFIERCLAEFGEVNFVEQDSGRVFLRVVSGAPAWADTDAWARALADDYTGDILKSVLPGAFAGTLPAPVTPVWLGDDERTHTIGAWGTSPPAAGFA